MNSNSYSGLCKQPSISADQCHEVVNVSCNCCVTKWPLDKGVLLPMHAQVDHALRGYI